MKEKKKTEKIKKIKEPKWLWAALWPAVLSVVFTALVKFGDGKISLLTYSLGSFAIFYLINWLIKYKHVKWLALFAIANVPMATMSILIKVVGNQPFNAIHYAIFFSLLLGAVLLALWIALHYQLIEKPSRSSFTAKKLVFNLVRVLAGVVLLLIGTIVAGMVKNATDAHIAENQASLNNMATQIPMLIFALTTVSAGFFEELTYRVAIFEEIFKGKMIYLAFIVSALIFALMHGPTDIYSWVSYGLMSLILTGFYAKYRNFYLNMCIHGAWNLLVVLIMLSQQ